MRRIIGLILVAIAVYAAARGICRIWPKLCS
jgi:small neutral amino acid transporter SnatA (MarC family)